MLSLLLRTPVDPIVRSAYTFRCSRCCTGVPTILPSCLPNRTADVGGSQRRPAPYKVHTPPLPIFVLTLLSRSLCALQTWTAASRGSTRCTPWRV